MKPRKGINDIMTTTTTNTRYNWIFKNKTNGKLMPAFSFETREAARKAANMRKYNGLYTVVRVTPNTRKVAKVAAPVAPSATISLSKARKIADFKTMGNSFTSRAIAKAPSITKGYLV